MIDMNASLGNWPFGRLEGTTPSSLLALMDRHGIDQAAVAPLEGLFYRDLLSANVPFLKSIRKHANRFLSFAVVNPAFPGWNRDLRTCLGNFSITGVRLFPSYHSYELDDPCCRDLLTQLEQLNLPVQIAPSISDVRMHHPRAVVRPCAVRAIPALVKKYSRLRVHLINFDSRTTELVKPLARIKPWNFFVDISWADGVAVIDELTKDFSPGSVLFGTNAPLFYPGSAVYKLREARLTVRQRMAITVQNARRFLGMGQS